MGITLSPQDSATAFRILAATAMHPENIARLVEERLLPRRPRQPAPLDVGAGPGLVAERLAACPRTPRSIRGFGFLHDGGHDTLFHFLHAGPDGRPLPWRCPGLRGCRAG